MDPSKSKTKLVLYIVDLEEKIISAWKANALSSEEQNSGPLSLIWHLICLVILHKLIFWPWIYSILSWNTVPVSRHDTLAEQATNTTAVRVPPLHDLYYTKDLSLTTGPVWVDPFCLDVAQLT